LSGGIAEVGSEREVSGPKAVRQTQLEVGRLVILEAGLDEELEHDCLGICANADDCDDKVAVRDKDAILVRHCHRHGSQPFWITLMSHDQ
jgi:hypothetical protein